MLLVGNCIPPVLLILNSAPRITLFRQGDLASRESMVETSGAAMIKGKKLLVGLVLVRVHMYVYWGSYFP